MAACTIFKNFATPVEDVSLIILANRIASHQYKGQVKEIRDLVASGRTEDAQTRKQQLPAFTPSATFKEKRLLPNMEQYSGFVHLDFDKLTNEQLEAAFQIMAAIPYTFLCFVSPSGNGLKVFVEVTTGAELHNTAYQQVMKYYENASGLQADVKCKDITRLCFVSHDPQLYKNLYNEKFPIKIERLSDQTGITTPGDEPNDESNPRDQYLLKFQQQVFFTNKKLPIPMETVIIICTYWHQIVTVPAFLSKLHWSYARSILTFLKKK